MLVYWLEVNWLFLRNNSIDLVEVQSNKQIGFSTATNAHTQPAPDLVGVPQFKGYFLVKNYFLTFKVKSSSSNLFCINFLLWNEDRKFYLLFYTI